MVPITPHASAVAINLGLALLCAFALGLAIALPIASRFGRRRRLRRRWIVRFYD
jgi:hypothetical protein